MPKKRKTDYTTISIPVYVKERIAGVGTFNETWEDLLIRLVKEYEEYQKMKERFRWT